MTNYDIKKKMIKNILKDIDKKKELHYKKYSKYKKINTTFKSIINFLNSVSVCSLVLSFSPVSSPVLIIALSTTTISGLSSAAISAYELEHKIHSHNTSYLQYTDIYRDISARLRRNGLSSQDLDNMLTEINSRLGLIEDQSLPVKMDRRFSTTDLLKSPEEHFRNIEKESIDEIISV